MRLAHPLILLAVTLLAAPALHAQNAPTAPDTPAASSAPQDEAARWDSLTQLAEQGVEVETYRADFKQEKITPLLRDPIESSGTIRVAGGVSRWDTLEPYPSTMMVAQGELRLYYPEQKTLEIYDLGERLDAMAASPIPNLDLLREAFSLEAVDRSDDAVKLRLLPREEELEGKRQRRPRHPRPGPRRPHRHRDHRRGR